MSMICKNSRWVPSVYLMQGLPFALVMGVSPILYKNLGYENSDIAFYTSLFMFPYVLKFFFAPALEKVASKSTLILLMQFLMAALILLLGVSLYFSKLFYLNGICFILIALASSLHDINSDGFYLEVLTLQEQASWIGIRTLFYQLGKLLCQGGLIFLVGVLDVFHSKQNAWAFILFILGFSVLLLSLYNQKIIPRVNQCTSNHTILKSYHLVFRELLKLPHLIGGIIFLLLFNFPELQLVKIFPLFMLDSVQQGGLGLSVESVGLMYGVLGVSSLVSGVILSGFLLARLTLKKCLIPFTIILAVANMSYLFLIFYPSPSHWQISLCIVISQVGFGLSNGAYMLYLIHLFAKGTYSMSLYAIGTAIMLLGALIAGASSGYLQTLLHYRGFFMLEIGLSILMIFLSIYNVKKIL